MPFGYVPKKVMLLNGLHDIMDLMPAKLRSSEPMAAKIQALKILISTNAERTEEQKARIGQGVSAAGQSRRETERFVVEVRGGDATELVGWEALIAHTGLKEGALRVRFSTGRGEFSYVHNDELRTVTREHQATRQAQERAGARQATR